MSLLDIFRKPAAPPEYNPSVEEILASRRKELLAKLAHVDAECEELSTRIGHFFFEHRTSDGGYRAASLEELGTLPERARALQQREWLLNQERSSILSELSKLITNPSESIHLEGRPVNRAL
jgi:hypothetical protein